MGELSRIEKLISRSDEDFQTDSVNLLHELWYSKTQDEFTEIVDGEPRAGLTESRFNYVFTAAVICYFSIRKGFNAPEWAWDEEKYKLDEMWFSGKGPYSRARELIVSPGTFARRNMFLDGDSLIPM